MYARALKEGEVENTGHWSQVLGHCFTNTEATLTLTGLIKPKVTFTGCLGYFLYC